jgi:hypothetical protein
MSARKFHVFCVIGVRGLWLTLGEITCVEMRICSCHVRTRNAERIQHPEINIRQEAKKTKQNSKPEEGYRRYISRFEEGEV